MWSTSSDPKANPFRMPTDEEVFVLRDEEKRQKALEREKLQSQKVHEKTTWSARVGASYSQAARDFSDHDESKAAANIHAEVHLPTIDVREKDNMTVYIQKKREMGLARMSLATKRQEIKKLDEEANRAEQRLRQQQDQLASTHEKFNNFLKHSNLEQDAAVKRADLETKAKQEKLLEIKKLSAQIAQLDSDKKKNEEQLEQCLKFKRFLDDLTKPNWFYETLTTLKVEDEKQRILHAIEAEYAEDLVDAMDQEEQEKHQNLMMEQLESRTRTVAKTIQKQVDSVALDGVKQDLDTFPPHRVPMFFTEPGQILEQFINIEEGNLFLIQNCQELEEEIENITQQFQQEQQEIAQIQSQRRAQMDIVSGRIQVEQQKMRSLLERLERVTGSELVTPAATTGGKNGSKEAPAKANEKNQEVRPLTQEELKGKIEDKIKAIFKTLNNLADETNMDSLGMLAYIETKLEEMHQTIKNPKNGIEESFVATVMKQRDKDRRREARQVMLNKQAEEREERSKKALERSQAPVMKRVGKPVMWRSRPLDHKKKETVTKQETTVQEDDEFFM